MRTKEDMADYRYTPDPDLPPLCVSQDWIDAVRQQMPELPQQMVARFVADYKIPEYDAVTLTQTLAMARYFEETARACGAAKLASNWIMGELSQRLNATEIDIAQAPVRPADLAALITRITDGTISNAAARQVFDVLWEAGGDVDAIIAEKGLKQMQDTGALEQMVDDVIAANPGNVEQFKAGKDRALNALVGQVMKASRGKANPARVNELLRQRIGG